MIYNTIYRIKKEKKYNKSITKSITKYNKSITNYQLIEYQININFYKPN